jgi:hypothetical protein
MCYSGLWTDVLGLGAMAFNATFNNSSVISWQSVLLAAHGVMYSM